LQPGEPRSIALYGGSFNPPHVAHQLVMTWVLATQTVDEVWVMPTPRHAFGKPLAPFEDRVKMLELATRHFGTRVRVSTLESELPAPSRTLDTLKALFARHPGLQVSLVIGADILPETPQWKGWTEIEKMVDIIVLGRGGYPVAGNFTLPEVSSTLVRALIKDGGDASHLLDRQVLGYALRRQLYA
jgi:nicotinate-nucleotide adenylyltransferase